MSEYSAEASALGYIYQVRYALYYLLTIGDEHSVSIECLDDISFEKAGTVSELLQLKHHLVRKASLTDMSVDLWKSLRVWSNYLLENQKELPILKLITTAMAPKESAAYYLRPECRDEANALNRINLASQTSENTALKDCFNKFNLLNQHQKQLLISKIIILDGSPFISNLENMIKKELRLAVLPNHIQGLYERLEGWWLNKAILYLNRKSSEPIDGLEVHYKINDIAKSFEPEALPIDFLDIEPPDMPDPINDSRLFVKQLREISVDTKRIEYAIKDFHKAFTQRSRWTREELLIDQEIEVYEKKLIGEWERFSLAIKEDLPAESSEEILKKIGRKVYNWVEFTAQIPIRPKCNEAYVMRGSYHMLANEDPPRVWWHPSFKERITALLGGNLE
ncbi:MAG: ABC-three component system protein [Sporomusaceae bacterium]|nr:ABC-three component system protein [Sporomusaceae bacterium]